MGGTTVNTAVAIIGWGRSGRSAARALLARGYRVEAFDQCEPEVRDESNEAVTLHICPDPRELAHVVVSRRPLFIVVSPGISAQAPIFAAAHQADIEVIGEVELAWRLQEAGPHAGRPWLVVTGTNGKTTTVGMLAAILRANGENVREVGNIGTAITEAIDSDAQVFAVEMSSFQLHTTVTVSPQASVCLNVDADHLDWHGSAEAYAADKARIYERTQVACVYPAQDSRVERMVEEADVIEGARAIGTTLEIPAVSQVGLVEDVLVDRAFLEDRRTHALELARLCDLEPAYGPCPSPAVIADALAAAALARAHGVAPEAVSQGLRRFVPASHRRSLIGQAADVNWIDDSKATNAHAALASLEGVPYGRAIWIFGGDAKGQDFRELVTRVAPRLRGVVVIGEDREPEVSALKAYAPQVPFVEVDAHEDWMFSVVNEAVALSRPGDTVVLAPATASWDQFRDYGERGRVFADAVRRLAQQWGRADDGAL